MSIANGYKIMWMLVMFDLPTGTRAERKSANKFRNDLLDMGFQMHQFSVYTKRCPGREKVDSVIKKINHLLPKDGKVNIMWITDKQFSNSVQICNGIRLENPPDKEQNLLLF